MFRSAQPAMKPGCSTASSRLMLISIVSSPFSG